jgi:hypothetical protein
MKFAKLFTTSHGQLLVTRCDCGKCVDMTLRGERIDGCVPEAMLEFASVELRDSAFELYDDEVAERHMLNLVGAVAHVLQAEGERVN